MWSSVKGDLAYAYGELLVKSLSPVEAYFLNDYRNGVNSVLNYNTDFVNEHYDILSELSDDEFEDYWQEEFINEILITLLNELQDRVNLNIGRFYNTGSNLIHNQLNKTPTRHKCDEYALSNLQKYTSKVTDSITSELLYGCKNVIKTNKDIEPYKVNEKILNLPYHRIESYFPIDTRCVLTSITEYNRAVNTGILQTYENYNVKQYDVVTSGLSNVCKDCRNNEQNNPYTFEEIQTLVPFHPKCQCSIRGYTHPNMSLNPHPRIVDLTPNNPQRKK